MQTYTSGFGAYSLQYPDHWEWNVDESSLSFYDSGENGVGVFLVTEFELVKGVEIDVKAQLAESICKSRDLDLAKVSAGIQQDKNKFWTTLENDDIYWMYWIFIKDQMLLYITYNCHLPNKGIEQEIVHEIAASIKFA